MLLRVGLSIFWNGETSRRLALRQPMTQLNQ